MSEALDAYLKVRALRCSAATMANDRSVLRRFVDGVGAQRPVHELTPARIETYFSALQEQAPSSFNKIRSRVSGFLSFCQRRGWLRVDVMAEVLPQRVVRRERLRLSGPQLMALLDVARTPRDRAMLATAMNTGLRASELTALRVRDVDLDRGTVFAHITKSGLEDRLPVTQELDVELRRWLTNYAKSIQRPLQPEDYLFPAQRPPRWDKPGEGQVLIHGDLQPDVRQTHPARVVQRALKDIGIDALRHEGFHTLRRSVGRLVFDEASKSGHDAALRLTAALLHHSSTATTEHYLGLDADRQKRDEFLRGQALLSKVVDDSNVVSIRPGTHYGGDLNYAT